MTKYAFDDDLMQVARVGHYLIEEIQRGVAPHEALDAISMKLHSLAEILLFEVPDAEDVVLDDEPDCTAPDPAVEAEEPAPETITVSPVVVVNGDGDATVQCADVGAAEASLAEIMDQIRARVLEPIEDIDAREAAALAEVAAVLPAPVEDDGDQTVHPRGFEPAYT